MELRGGGSVARCPLRCLWCACGCRHSVARCARPLPAPRHGATDAHGHQARRPVRSAAHALHAHHTRTTPLDVCSHTGWGCRRGPCPPPSRHARRCRTAHALHTRHAAEELLCTGGWRRCCGPGQAAGQPGTPRRADPTRCSPPRAPCQGLFNAVGPLFGLPFVTGSLPHSPQFVRALRLGERLETRAPLGFRGCLRVALATGRKNSPSRQHGTRAARCRQRDGLHCPLG